MNLSLEKQKFTTTSQIEWMILNETCYTKCIVSDECFCICILAVGNAVGGFCFVSEVLWFHDFICRFKTVQHFAVDIFLNGSLTGCGKRVHICKFSACAVYHENPNRFEKEVLPLMVI